MWYPAEISLSSYLPDELQEGMLFINRISVGVVEPYIELFELEEVPEDADAFMAKHGAADNDTGAVGAGDVIVNLTYA